MQKQKKAAVHYLSVALYAILFWIMLVLITLAQWFFTVIQLRHVKKFLRRKIIRRKILFLDSRPEQNAGRFRSKMWKSVLNAHEFDTSVWHLFNDAKKWDATESATAPITFHFVAMLRRTSQCLGSLPFDVVVVRREALLYNDYGNLFIEKLLHAMHRHLVLDFDDDLAVAKREPRHLTLFGRLMLEHPTKFSASIRFYQWFIVGNRFLKEKFLDKKRIDADHILIMPTCVHYNRQELKHHNALQKELVLGWIGTPENLKQLEYIVPELNRLAAVHPFRIHIISSQTLKAETLFEVVHVPWQWDRDAEHLLQLDIGLMPLQYTDESRGKCGFKLIQYMNFGLIGVASALGMNKEIVNDGVNGFLVNENESWTEVLSRVFSQREKFSLIGELAAKKVRSNYSFVANEINYVSFFQKITQH